MFKILSLDGGGIKGAFTAAVLDELQQNLETSLVDQFNLIVGTSTGGIIALGMACGVGTDKLLSLYRDQGRQIFPKSEQGKFLDWIFRPKYESRELKEILLRYFPARLFVELECALAITSFDASSAKPVVFKTHYHPTLTAHRSLSVVDVAMATSAAPTYFAASDSGCGVMLDGGIWANCPVMVGVTEAISLFGKKVSEIAMLSIGTTSIPTFVTHDERNGGLLDWVKPAPSLLMHAAKHGALSQAAKLCGKLIRIDETVSPDRFALDAVTEVKDLEQIGRKAGRERWNEVQSVFFPKAKKIEVKGAARIRTAKRRAS
jgi:hypothetical protein